MVRWFSGAAAHGLVGVLALGLVGLAWFGCGDDDEVSFSGSSTSTAGSAASSGAGGNGAGGSASGGAGPGGSGSGGQPAGNNGFPDQWIDGTNCGSEPDVQQWAYADDTFILRQSLCSNFEGPFIYVLLGEQAVLVQDSGTGAVNLYQSVAAIVAQWEMQRGVGPLPVYLTHSHGHGDHVGGDGQFAGQPNVTVVASGANAVQSFFGFSNWPDEPVTFDLGGGRVLDVLGIPGHQSAHVAVYDRRHDLLLTGDTLYPGRLYINNWSQYQASIQRLVDFVEAGNPAQWVLGTHIEMRNTGGDYNFGATQHPDEHPLQLGYEVLVELNTAVQAMGNNPVYQEHDDFIVYP